MPRIAVSKLTERQLDWAVLTAQGMLFMRDERGTLRIKGPNGAYWGYFCDDHPSSDWNDGGYLIERERIAVEPMPDGTWTATIDLNEGDAMVETQVGRTALIAACRVYVVSVLGPSVDYPWEDVSVDPE